MFFTEKGVEQENKKTSGLKKNETKPESRNRTWNAGVNHCKVKKIQSTSVFISNW